MTSPHKFCAARPERHHHGGTILMQRRLQNRHCNIGLQTPAALAHSLAPCEFLFDMARALRRLGKFKTSVVEGVGRSPGWFINHHNSGVHGMLLSKNSLLTAVSAVAFVA